MEISDIDSPALDVVLEDVKRVFGYKRHVKPQDRAHAYLGEHDLYRAHDESALHVAARDMVLRAYRLGARSAAPPDLEDISERAYALYADIASLLPGEGD